MADLGFEPVSYQRFIPLLASAIVLSLMLYHFMLYCIVRGPDANNSRSWTSLITSIVNLLLSRMPARRRKAKVGVMWLEGWPGLQLPISNLIFDISAIYWGFHGWPVPTWPNINPPKRLFTGAPIRPFVLLAYRDRVSAQHISFPRYASICSFPSYSLSIHKISSFDSNINTPYHFQNCHNVITLS